MGKFFWLYHIIICIILALIVPALCSTKLTLLHVITRHGKRTTYAFYPTDPYKAHTFYPIGLGGLLNAGKLRSYEVGVRLRKEYGCFLDGNYVDDIVYATSTDFPRTRMTAALILAGLYPPSSEQMWHSTLMWQPIPIYTKPFKLEDTINPNCEYRQQLMNELPFDPNVRKEYIEPHSELFQYIEKNSGMNITTLHDLLEFFFIVNAEAQMQLTQPEWVSKIYPNPLEKVSGYVYNYLNSNMELRRINTGYMLKKIIHDVESKKMGILNPSSTKMFLIAGHETTIGYLQSHMNITEPHIPPYSSSLIFETYKDEGNNYFIKMKYLRGPQKDMEVLKLPGCDIMCPLEQFKSLNDDVIPKISLDEACSKKANA